MARFRGILQGTRGEATRLGSPNSGLVAIANGWGGGVHVALFDKSGADWTRITLTRGSGGAGGPDLIVYEGPIDADRVDRASFIASRKRIKTLAKSASYDDERSRANDTE